MSLKLDSKIIYINGQGGEEFAIIVTEPRSGKLLDIAIQSNKGAQIKFDTAILSEINEGVMELQCALDLKKNPNPNRVALVD